MTTSCGDQSTLDPSLAIHLLLISLPIAPSRFTSAAAWVIYVVTEHSCSASHSGCLQSYLIILSTFIAHCEVCYPRDCIVDATCCEYESSCPWPLYFTLAIRPPCRYRCITSSAASNGRADVDQTETGWGFSCMVAWCGGSFRAEAESPLGHLALCCRVLA